MKSCNLAKVEVREGKKLQPLDTRYFITGLSYYPAQVVTTAYRSELTHHPRHRRLQEQPRPSLLS